MTIFLQIVCSTENLQYLLTLIYLKRDFCAHREAVCYYRLLVGALPVPAVEFDASAASEKHLSVNLHRRFARQLVTCTGTLGIRKQNTSKAVAVIPPPGVHTFAGQARRPGCSNAVGCPHICKPGRTAAVLKSYLMHTVMSLCLEIISGSSDAELFRLLLRSHQHAKPVYRAPTKLSSSSSFFDINFN